MNWDSENKRRLYVILWDTFEKMAPGRLSMSSDRRREFCPEVTRFLKKFGIDRVAGPAPWMVLPGDFARSKKHVIIVDPWEDSRDIPDEYFSSRLPKDAKKGLRIPKDVAERFLVLGVP